MTTRVASLLRWLLALLWLAETVLIVADWPPLRHVAEAGIALYLVAALFAARRQSLVLCAIVGGAAALVAWRFDLWLAALDGLRISLMFAGLMPILIVTRVTASLLPAVIESRRRLAALPEAHRRVAQAWSTHAFGAVLNTGALSVAASLSAPGASAEERLRIALSSMQGLNLAVLWSPFFVGMGYIASRLPAVPAWQTLLLGLALACGALAGAGARLVGLRRLPASLAATLRALAPIGLPAGIAAGAVVAAATWLASGTLEAVILVMPLLCGAVLLPRRGALAQAAAETMTGMARLHDEILVVSVALLLGAVLAQAPAIADALAPLLGDAPPAPLVLAILLGGMVLPSILGIHPIVTVTILLVVLGRTHHAVAPIVLLQAGLLGWALGTLISPSSLSVVIAARLFDVPVRRLVWSPNTGFVALMAAASLAALLGLNALLR
ncbi:MAG: hypothetical protein JNK11_12230 [Alphaproteobacteria bacterium]|nr:hypothetical protein [Alphaproteobacteria bacterium]